MDIYSEKSFLKRLVYVLVTLNIILISLLLWKEFHHTKKVDPAAFRDVSQVLKQELQLNDEQVVQFKKLRADYYEKEQTLGLVLRAERDSMNQLMFNKNTNEEKVKALALEVSNNEYQMEMIRLDQAKALKALCTPKQLEKFEGLVIEIRDFFRPDNQPGKKW
jgi:Spy/CpxP family protein refolding chaperone